MVSLLDTSLALWSIYTFFALRPVYFTLFSLCGQFTLHFSCSHSNVSLHFSRSVVSLFYTFLALWSVYFTLFSLLWSVYFTLFSLYGQSALHFSHSVVSPGLSHRASLWFVSLCVSFYSFPLRKQTETNKQKKQQKQTNKKNTTNKQTTTTKWNKPKQKQKQTNKKPSLFYKAMVFIIIGFEV